MYSGELRRDIQLFPAEKDSAGNPSWILFDPVSDRYFRLSETRKRIAALMDRSRELEDFKRVLEKSAIHIDDAQLLEFLSFLRQNNLLVPLYSFSEKQFNKFRNLKASTLGDRLIASYLFLRLPLLKPDRFLDRTCDMVRRIFNKWTLLFLSLIALCGYIGLIRNWHEFTDAFINSINFQGLIRYTLAVCVIKVVHEFSHAYTAKSYGVRVRRMGVAFIVFLPRIFTDLTDAWRLPSRKSRLLIDGAGIISETFCGGFAALIWLNTAPGTVHTIAYYLFAVSIINTVLVNGNPFIRYDGYYMLMDITNIDNLQRRGTELIVRYFRKWCFGIDMPQRDKFSTSRKTFLVAYGICSFIYRMFLYTSIILIVYLKFTKSLGIFLLVLEVYSLILKPLMLQIKSVSHMKKNIKRRNMILSLSGALFILLLLSIPLPRHALLPAEVRPERSTIIYVNVEGFLEKIAVKDNEQVKAGQELFSQYNPFLRWNFMSAKADLDMARCEVDQLRSYTETIGRSQVTYKRMQASENILDELRRKNQMLETRAPFSGIFALYERHLKPGKWLRRGEVVGEVFSPKGRIIVGYVKESEVGDLNEDSYAKFAMNDELLTVGGRVTSISRLPKTFSPSPLLSLFGGPIICYQDPQSNQIVVSESYYEIKVKVDSDKGLEPGRTGTLAVRRYASILGDLFHAVLQVLQRELTF